MSLPPAIPASFTLPGFLAASLLVAGGGALGAWLRFATARMWTMAIGPIAASAFPWSTLTVNVLGSLAMGLLAGWLARHGGNGAIHPESWRLLLGVGVLGGYTTFSAFAWESFEAVDQGSFWIGLANLAGSVVLGYFAVWCGVWLIRR